MRWLRLLSLKNQLRDVNRYVRVQQQGNLTLRLVKPVVHPDDLRLLIAAETLRTTNQDRITWVWTYEKQSAETNAAPRNFDLSFTAVFENLKFSEFRFPGRFLAIFPKPLVIGLLRSLGQAEVDVKRRTFQVTWVGPGDNEKVELPGKPQITALLGAPFLVTQSNRTQTFLYKYYQKVTKPQSPASRLAWARFTFANKNSQVLNSQGVVGNLGWDMTCVPEEPEPRITFFLAPLTVEPVALQLPPAIADDYVGQYRDPTGAVLDLRRDGNIFVADWVGKGWSILLPETKDVLFVPPAGWPRYKFIRNTAGAVTGLIVQQSGSEQRLTKLAAPLPPAPVAVQVGSKACEACAGRYKTAWGSTVTVCCEGGQLFWQQAGLQARLPLYPASQTNFFFKAVASPLTFVKNDRGQVTKFILHYCGRTAEALKVKGP